ncbi:Extradiol aromatic ring-opening dioxygenase [Auriculariales sp. MPI-PUGE-AT-0066]|nr:Extradiol aromatic ring-opening dioxygenase [Auriculariales sp. MPI-PUGE-AT-0066]
MSLPMNIPTWPTTPTEWRAALHELPSSPSKIPAFYFAHGRPLLIWPDSAGPPHVPSDIQNPGGPLSQEFGPALLKKYCPKAIVVFSAHWETDGETLVSDWGDEPGANGQYHDFYNFPREVYEAANFESRGSSALSRKLVEMFQKANIQARTTTKPEPRGRDGLGELSTGLDHGCTVPFTLMFGKTFNDVPIVAVSIDSSMRPEKEWALGRALDGLRSEGVLILAGGLPVHTLHERSSFSLATAAPIFKDWSNAILEAASVQHPQARQEVLFNLTNHAGFRRANPREDHFVPLYVAAGAGQEGGSKVVCALYGAPTIAFGI